MKSNFIISMLSGPDGVSSKRSVMVFFVLLYAFTLLVNLFTGKAPSEMYQEQLFELVIIVLGLVFGEKVMDGIKSMRNGNKPEPAKPIQ